jgi:hypothetical protein
VSYIFFSLSIIHHLESGLAASQSLLQKHALNERRFEVEKPEYPEKTTDLSQVTDKRDPIKLYRQLSNVKYIGINKDNE